MNITEKILGSPVTRIEEGSKNILDVFTKTINDLESLNKDADTELAKREEIIKKAQEEQSLLTAVKEKNTTVITKIQRIFE